MTNKICDYCKKRKASYWTERQPKIYRISDGELIDEFSPENEKYMCKECYEKTCARNALYKSDIL